MSLMIILSDWTTKGWGFNVDPYVKNEKVFCVCEKSEKLAHDKKKERKKEKKKERNIFSSAV